MTCILITRPNPGARFLADKLLVSGYTYLIDPLLEIIEIPCPPFRHDSYDGYILTSQHAVPALERSGASPLSFVLTVGATTQCTVQQAGFKNVESAGGSLGGIKQWLRKHCKEGSYKNFLYLSGRDIRQPLFSFNTITIERAIVYEARLKALQLQTIEALKENKIQEVWFYSGRVAESFIQETRRHGVSLGQVIMRGLSPYILKIARPGGWFAQFLIPPLYR